MEDLQQKIGKADFVSSFSDSESDDSFRDQNANPDSPSDALAETATDYAHPKKQLTIDVDEEQDQIHSKPNINIRHSSTFKSVYDFSQRSQESNLVRLTHPNLIPVICERHVVCKNVDNITKNMFLVPKNLQMAQLGYIIKKRIQTTVEENQQAENQPAKQLAQSGEEGVSTPSSSRSKNLSQVFIAIHYNNGINEAVIVPPPRESILTLFEKFKDEDGFLYISYSDEATQSNQQYNGNEDDEWENIHHRHTYTYSELDEAHFQHDSCIQQEVQQNGAHQYNVISTSADLPKKQTTSRKSSVFGSMFNTFENFVYRNSSQASSPIRSLLDWQRKNAALSIEALEDKRIKRTSEQWLASRQLLGREFLALCNQHCFCEVCRSEEAYKVDDYMSVDDFEDVESNDEVTNQILRDIPRTFPEVEYFSGSTIRDRLLTILSLLAEKYPTVGYVQGINFIAAFAMVHFEEEGEDDLVYELMCRIFSCPRFNFLQVYAAGFPKLVRYNAVLSKLLAQFAPSLHRHLVDIGLDSLYFSHHWILTLFAYTMPFDHLTKVWVFFFQKGWEAVFRICLVLLTQHEAKLLHCDFEHATKLLRCTPMYPPKDLVSIASLLVFNEAQLAFIQEAISCDEEEIEEQTYADKKKARQEQEAVAPEEVEVDVDHDEDWTHDSFSSEDDGFVAQSPLLRESIKAVNRTRCILILSCKQVNSPELKKVLGGHLNDTVHSETVTDLSADEETLHSDSEPELDEAS